MAEGHEAGVRLLQCAAHTSLQMWQSGGLLPNTYRLERLDRPE